MEFENVELSIKPLVITRKADKQGRIVLPNGWQDRAYILYVVKLPSGLKTERVKTGILLVPAEE